MSSDKKQDVLAKNVEDERIQIGVLRASVSDEEEQDLSPDESESEEKDSSDSSDKLDDTDKSRTTEDSGTTQQFEQPTEVVCLLGSILVSFYFIVYFSFGLIVFERATKRHVLLR